MPGRPNDAIAKMLWKNFFKKTWKFIRTIYDDRYDDFDKFVK